MAGCEFDIRGCLGNPEEGRGRGRGEADGEADARLTMCKLRAEGSAQTSITSSSLLIVCSTL